MPTGETPIPPEITVPLGELSEALKNNGWTYFEDETSPLFGRTYNRENNPILQGTEWTKAIDTFREEHTIPEGTSDILVDHKEKSIDIFVLCDKRNRDDLMRALELDRHLRIWGFESDDGRLSTTVPN